MTTLVIHGVTKIDADGAVADFWVRVDGDRITATGTGETWPQPEGATVIDGAGARLVPGFIDQHVHGGGGTAFDGGDPAAIQTALAVHRRHGTTRAVLSLVAAPVADMAQSLRAIGAAMRVDPLILGAHLEGPFLAHERRGAHEPAFLIDPDAESVSTLLEAGEGILRQVTIAPEKPGALDAIARFAAAGVVPAVGHTTADFAQTQAAFDAGARLLTHAFNAMNGIGHRLPGPVIAAFEDERIVLEIVADGIHLHAGIIHLAFTGAPGRVALITDAMAAAGNPDGDYLLGTLPVTVTDGVAMLTGGSSIAGSTLTQDRALSIAVAAGVSEVDAVTALTATPARVLGVDDRLGYLRPGYLADLVLLDDDGRPSAVWANGTALIAG